MFEYIEERVPELANHIIENGATVRQAAKRYGISKSAVHIAVTLQNGLHRSRIQAAGPSIAQRLFTAPL